MNENGQVVPLRDCMDAPEGWGRVQGRQTYRRLLDYVEANPGVMVFRISLKGVARVDISFASETVVELARRYRGSKGFCLIDVADSDLLENLESAAAKRGQPMALWDGSALRVIGAEPSEGAREALAFALKRPQARAAEFAAARRGMSIANASMKFRQLWEQGFLLRRESAAETGGIEYVYHRIA